MGSEAPEGLDLQAPVSERLKAQLAVLGAAVRPAKSAVVVELEALLRSTAEQAALAAQEGVTLASTQAAAQEALDESVSNANLQANKSRMLKGPRANPEDPRIWRKIFPALSEQGIQTMMAWRRVHQTAETWPKAVWVPEQVNGKPTGKYDILKVLEEGEVWNG